MRILHLTDHYSPVLGGIESHVHDLAHRQAARGDEVTVLTSTPAHADGREDHDTGPVRVHRARSVLAASTVDVASYDVVHAHISVVAPFTAPVAALLSRRGLATLVTVHSMWNGLGPLPGLAAAASGLRGAPVVWAAVSTLAAAQLRHRIPADRHVRVIPNATDVPARDRTPHRPDGEPVRLVSTMRIARRKRPLPLLRMVREVHRSAAVPVRLTVIGDGPLRPRVERDARRWGLADLVRVTGRLEPDGVRDALARADLYLAPAVLESFGLAALEARCTGLPVIGRTSGVREFVTDGVHGRLAASDAAMAAALTRLVEDEDARFRIAEHNRTTPAGLTWELSLQLHDRAYAHARDLARRPTAGRRGLVLGHD